MIRPTFNPTREQLEEIINELPINKICRRYHVGQERLHALVEAMKVGGVERGLTSQEVFEEAAVKRKARDRMKKAQEEALKGLAEAAARHTAGKSNFTKQTVIRPTIRPGINDLSEHYERRTYQRRPKQEFLDMIRRQNKSEVNKNAER